MNALQTFNSEFGRIRSVKINSEPWFVGKDIADALGYENARKELTDHVDDEDKRLWKIQTTSGVQDMTVVNESGVYSLILASKLPSAKQFKHWVTSEVLPSIRRTGKYDAESAKIEERRAKLKMEEAKMEERKEERRLEELRIAERKEQRNAENLLAAAKIISSAPYDRVALICSALSSFGVEMPKPTEEESNIRVRASARLKQCNDNGMSLADLSKRLRLGRSSVHRYITGERLPTENMAYRILRMLPDPGDAYATQPAAEQTETE